MGGPLTRPSLLLRIREAHAADAWEEFDRIYRPIIMGYCGRRSLQAADAEDLAQRILMIVRNAIGRFDYRAERGGFRRWLCRITAHEVAHFWKDRARWDYLLQSGVRTDPIDDQEDPDWVQEFTDGILQAAIEAIRPEYDPATWDAFESTWRGDRPGKEVADRLGWPVTKVHKSAHLVRKRLREQILHLTDDSTLLLFD